MANHYDVPSWAGKPPVGLHLDVTKGDKLIQKLMIDEKKCYLFGRNPQLNDFCIDHASCSRVHSALVYHKHLNRAFLVDLGSTHGTYIGSIRIESNKPTQLPIDSIFHFGASTRMYIIRERPQAGTKSLSEEKEKTGEEIEGGLLGLPETETELDNLTEFNTAHNRRISMLGIPEEEIRPSNRKKKKKNVFFNDDEEVINPEDIDPSIGKFRNLIQTTVIPTKRRKIEGYTLDPNLVDATGKHYSSLVYNTLYEDLPVPGDQGLTSPVSLLFPSSLSGKLGLCLPNPAPDVELAAAAVQVPVAPTSVVMELIPEPRKKKYAKEAWPGKKPLPSLLV